MKQTKVGSRLPDLTGANKKGSVCFQRGPIGKGSKLRRLNISIGRLFSMAKEMSELGYIVKRIHLNGVPKRIVADSGVTLLTVIRDQQKLTGTKRGF